MRRISLIIISIILIFSLTACSNTITLKIPSAVLKDEGDISLDEYAGTKGFISVTQTSSLFLEVVMTKSKHREIVRKSEKLVENRFDSIIKAENTEYIKKITHDKDFRSITVEVDKTGYESDSLDMIPNDMNLHQIGVLAIMHQIYTGLKQHTEVVFKDTITKETIYTSIYPNAIAPD